MADLLKNLAERYQSKNKEYKIYDMVVYNKELYQCIANTAGVWNPAAWKKVFLADLFKGIKNLATESLVFVSAAQSYNDYRTCTIIETNSDIVTKVSNVIIFKTSGKLKLYGTTYLHTSNTTTAIRGYDVYKNDELVEFVSNISEGATEFSGTSVTMSYIPYELDVKKGDTVFIQSRSNTASANPTFIVGYMIPEEINGNSGGVINLGTGTTFDIPKLLPSIDYTKLTADDFIVSSPNTTTCNSSTIYGSDTFGARATYVQPQKNYDATTGILTIENNNLNSQLCDVDSGNWTTVGSGGTTLQSTVYLATSRGNLCGVYNLGTGTSFDVSTKVPSVDYTQLTEANFIVHAVSNSMSGSYNSSDHSFSKSVGGSTKIVTSYDAATGVLTLHNTNLNVSDSVPTSGAWLNITSTITCQVYLIIGDILSV